MNETDTRNSFQKAIINKKVIGNLAERFPKYMQNDPILPENLERCENVLKETSNMEKASSIDETISFCSRLSRMTIDRVMFKEIFAKREFHSIFSSQAENIYKRVWYMKNQQNTIEGPFTPLEMDDRFKSRKINMKTLIKHKTDDDYYYLAKLARTYYKNVLSFNHDIEREINNLPNKVVRFRKGFQVSTPEVNLENFAPVCKRERVVSTVPKPNLVFLKNGDMSYQDNEEDQLHIRLRAKTFAR